MDIINRIKAALQFCNKEISISKETQEVVIYDEEHLRLQKLYEKWVCKEKWLLHKEGIPLLFGIDPEHYDIEEDVSNKMLELWKHAQECVSKKLLSIINIDDSAQQWEVLAIDLYRWAMISRITVPTEFSALIAFVIQTVKPEQNEPILAIAEFDSLLQKHKEIVLGAATSLLVNAPEKINTGKVKHIAMNISRLIVENKQQWFGENEPSLNESAMIDLINDYIELIEPIN